MKKNFLLLTILLFVPTISFAQTVSLQDKIDQLFVIGFRGTRYSTSPAIQKMLKETNLGGVILFDYDTPTKRYGRNIVTGAQVRRLTSDLQKNARTRLLIGIDEEGGSVSRLKRIPGYRRGVTAKVLGTRSLASVEATAFRLGGYLKSLGITTNFAPVLDVDTGKKNPIIGRFGRAFSSDPQTVALYGNTFASGLKRGGVAPVGKHFPGHGSALSDSHKEFTDITEVWTESELIPFEKACESGLGAVMVGHLVDKRVDTLPATLSKAHIDRLKRIGCDDALVITDDMDMAAITSHFTKEDAAVRALSAGVDMLIYSNNIERYAPHDFFILRKAVYNAVQNGALSESRIDLIS